MAGSYGIVRPDDARPFYLKKTTPYSTMSSSPSLSDNDFVILGVEPRFAQQSSDLMQRWKTLQAQAHPDRFATQGQAAQRLATQWSVRINEAYQRVKNPLTRAALLCELAGVPINAQTHVALPPAFLMQQMEWREQLEQAQTLKSIEPLQQRVAQNYATVLATLAECIDDKGDYVQAAQQIRSLMFVERFLKDIDRKLDALEA